MRFASAICVLIVATTPLWSQNTTDPSRLYLRPAAMVNLDVSEFFNDEITDNFIRYRSETFYLRAISAILFVKPKLGVELCFRPGLIGNSSDRLNQLNTELKRRYEDQYFITHIDQEFLNSQEIFPDLTRLNIGLVYRHELNKFTILTRLLVGFTSFAIDATEISLKEKGTNTVLTLKYEPEDKHPVNFTTAPALTLAYRITPKMHINFDVQYSFFKTDFKIKESLYNPLTEENNSSVYSYKKDIHTVSVALGLTLELGKIRPSKKE